MNGIEMEFSGQQHANTRAISIKIGIRTKDSHKDAVSSSNSWSMRAA